MQPNGKSIGGIGISTTGISTTARKPTNDNTDTSSQRAATRQFRHKQQTKTQTTLLPAPLGVYRALWLLFHALFRWYASARHTWQQAVHALAQRFEATNDWAVIDSGTRQLDCSTAAADDCNNATTKRECELIAKCRADLAKVPVHVAVILNERCEEAGMDDGETVAAQEAASMARLLRWVSYTGIEHISFYDYRGPISELRPELYREICAYRQRNNAAAQHPNGATRTNGTTLAPNGCNGNGNCTSMMHLQQTPHAAVKPLTVHLVDPAVNRTHLVDVSRALVDPKQQLQKQSNGGGGGGDDVITIPMVNAAVQQQLQERPEPELAFYFDEYCCTYGLSPWQIRLTEFLRLGTAASDVRLGGYLRALYKYAKCEQRFGK